MQFLAITSVAAGLIASASAAALANTNTNVATFRLWSIEGCPVNDPRHNQGVWPVLSDEFTNGECLALDTVHKSVNLQQSTTGCQITMYENAGCSSGAAVLSVNVCSTAVNQFVAFSVTCDGHA